MSSFDSVRPGAPPALRVGGVRYELIRRIGGGGSGDVHVARAVEAGFERLVCIKRLAGMLEEGCADALREEARLLAGVRHANVVSMLALGEEPGHGPFLVLEFVDGVDLSRLVNRLHRASVQLPDMVAVHVACALLRALGAVQRFLPGLVHRDVTPQNVLVSREGEIKLGDFGIALARDRTRWTRPTFVKGKLGYMAPEQIAGAELDPRTDLFAVGVILYELLCAERPWGPVRGIGELRAVAEQPLVPLKVHRRNVSPALAGVVERLLARRPTERFGSAEDALRALAPYGAGELGSLRLAGYVRRAET
ncbi:MAG: serine/threonine protein kinase [Myxococcota bacterium]|nr:serine/threonine protein kinase [Myxococcota bacterium]